MAAGAAGGEQDRSALAHSRRRARRASRSAVGRLRVSAMQEAHAEAERQQRRAAVGDERQRHALGRHGAQVDRHVDPALHAEHDDEAGRGEAAERVLVARGEPKAAHHDEAEEGDQRRCRRSCRIPRRSRRRRNRCGRRAGCACRRPRPARGRASRPTGCSAARCRPGRCRPCRRSIRIEKAQHALVHVRRELERGKAADHADAAEPTTQNQCSPAMKNSAAQTTEISIVWPKSGCMISGTMVSGSSRNARTLARASRSRRAARPR